MSLADKHREAVSNILDKKVDFWSKSLHEQAVKRIHQQLEYYYYINKEEIDVLFGNYYNLIKEINEDNTTGSDMVRTMRSSETDITKDS